MKIAKAIAKNKQMTFLINLLVNNMAKIMIKILQDSVVMWVNYMQSRYQFPVI